MLQEMRPSEFFEWMAYWTISPWGEERADLRAGIVASVIGNVNRDPKRRPQPYAARDFMPFREVDPEEHNRDLSKRLLAAFGVRTKKKGR